MQKNKLKKPVVICAIMKQEAPYLLEWVAYHKALGFDLIIADNGGRDETTMLLKSLHAKGVIKRLDFTWCRSKPQLPAYRALLRTANAEGYEIAGFIDTDEFFTKHFPLQKPSAFEGSDYIHALFEKTKASQYSFHWICYGSQTSTNDANLPVIERFHTHSNFDEFWNVNLKSFVRVKEMFSARNLLYLGPIIFSAHYFIEANRQWLIDGVPYKEFISTKPITHRNGQFLHYQIKTWDEYQAKIARGDAAFNRNKNNRAYFDHHDYAAQTTAVSDEVVCYVKQEVDKLKYAIENVKVSTKGDLVNQLRARWLSIGLSQIAGQEKWPYVFMKKTK